MYSRRAMLSSSFGLLSTVTLCAKDEFWSAKPIEQWSEEEIRKLQTKSPWAREVSVSPPGAGGGMRTGMPDATGGTGGDIGGSGGGMGGAMPGGMGGGGGRGGRGGGRGGMSGGSMPEIKLVVRWESALPIRKSSKIQWPAETDGNYILSVSGLPRFGQRPGAMRGDAKQEGAQRSPEDRQQLQDQVRAVTELRRKNHEPQPAEVVRIFDAGPRNTLICLFPVGKDPIVAAEKEVTFFTKVGPFEIKTKFHLKEMEFQGALAL